MNIKKIISLFFIFASVNLSATILDKEEVESADLTVLQNETNVFKSIGMGIALSIAQCEGVDLCSFTVEEDEISELINTLDERIKSLVLMQEEAENPVEFDKVLTAYINERDTYTSHLEKLKTIRSDVVDEDNSFDEFDLDSEEPDFPVESARNEELMDYLNEIQELEAFEDEELEDDEDLGDLPDLPDLDEINETP